MRTIGLIGGMSWESTVLYYRIINREVARRLGGLSSARIHLLSLNFSDIAQRQRADDWAGLADTLAGAARSLQQAGADCVLIGTNTMHKVAPEVQAATPLPLLHIADITGQAIAAQGLQRVGLLGTRFTMEQPFYAERLQAKGIACLVPPRAERDEVHRIIFEELCQGVFLDRSRETLLGFIDGLAARGAQATVLGCTELPLLIAAHHSPLPMFDTTELHALAAVEFALHCPPKHPPERPPPAMCQLLGM